MSEAVASAPVPHRIDVSKRGVTIEDTLLESVTVSALTDVLGAPRVVEPPVNEHNVRTANTVYFWDAAGVSAYSRDQETLSSFVILLDADEKPEWRQRQPHHAFAGQVTLNGRAPLRAVSKKHLRSGRFMQEAQIGDWHVLLMLRARVRDHYQNRSIHERIEAESSGEIAAYLLAHESPVWEVSVSYEPVRKSTGKWKHEPFSGETLSFDSLAFRYAVIHELMYVQQALLPKFDVFDFAADQGPRSFDPGENSGKIIPAVKSWFQKLPVPAELARRVESLYLDGGNEIYLQLAPQWDGEDDRYRIRSISDEELAQLPRLKKVEDIGGFLSPAARKKLLARGVEVTD